MLMCKSVSVNVYNLDTRIILFAGIIVKKLIKLYGKNYGIIIKVRINATILLPATITNCKGIPKGGYNDRRN